MKQTFVARLEWYNTISELPELEQLDIYRRIFLYQSGREEEAQLVTGFQRAVWALIESKLTKPKGAAKESTWQTDYNLYLSELEKAYSEIMCDRKFITEKEKYYPFLNIRLTIEKAHKTFWATEAGWKRKKRSGSKALDWRATFANALDQKFNHVYKQKGDSDGTTESRLHPALR